MGQGRGAPITVHSCPANLNTKPNRAVYIAFCFLNYLLDSSQSFVKKKEKIMVYISAPKFTYVFEKLPLQNLLE